MSLTSIDWLVSPAPQENRADQCHEGDNNTGRGEAGVEAKAVNEIAHYWSEYATTLHAREVIYTVYRGAVTLRSLADDIGF